MYAILHSFTYPLKPLTQNPISIQPIPILHATHNHVLPHPDASHPEFCPPTFHPDPDISLSEFLSAAIPSRRLTPGIPLRHHFIWVSHTRNSSPPPFRPGVSLPEFLCHHHFIRVFHTRNSSPPPFPWVSHSQNPSVPPFHPDVSHLKYLPRRHSLLRMPHILNSHP